MFLTSFLITLPETAISDILVNVSGIFTDLSPIILLVIGVFVGFWIISAVINLIRPPRAKESGYYHEFKDNYPTGRGRYYEAGEEFDDDLDDEDY